MKKMIFTLVALLTMSVSANAMSYEQARNEALFLTDKMAYELNLTDEQYEAAYEINLDYLMGVTGQADVFGPYWERRNLDLSYILYSWQWDAFRAATYFYRPLYWNAGYWHFGIYARYPHRDYFYFGRPHFYASYRGGHSWHMNGGRSYYEGRRDHFRPAIQSRSAHFGMRNGWDRGDYRGRGNSSTRVTGERRLDNNRYGNSRANGMNRGGEYRGNTMNRSFSDNGTGMRSNRSNIELQNRRMENSNFGTTRRSMDTRTVEGNRSVNTEARRSFGTTSRPSGGMGSSTRYSGSMGGSTRSSESFGSSTRSSGSMGSSTRSSGSFGSSSSRSSGSFGSSSSRSSSSSGSSRGGFHSNGRR